MTKLLKYMKGNRIIAVLAPLFKMLEATLELIVPLIIAEIVDSGIIPKNKDYVIKLSIQLIILGAVGLIFSITAQYFAAKAAVSTVKKLRHAAYEKVTSLSFSGLDKAGTSTLITRLTSDMDSVQNGINLTLRILLRSPFVVLGACIMAFRVDRHTSLIFFIAVPVLSLIIFAVMAVTIPLYKKIRETVDKSLLLVRENITGVRVIRAFCSEEKAVEEFKENNDILTGIQLFTGRISALLNPMTCVIVNLAIAALIYTGAVRVNKGLLTTGAVIALYNYLSQILVELIKLANLIVTVTKSFACGKRINALLEMQDEENEAAPADDEKSNSYIEFKNVSFSYSGNSENSVSDISFTVNKGDRIGIIGSTGSGKTTLINLLCGYYRPTRGTVFFKGIPLQNYDEKELRNCFALAEQKAVIFKGTVKSNLLLGKKNASDEEIIKALEIAQAADFVNEKENGTDSITEQSGRNFSGGQRQRLSIARAVIKNAEVLILDDAFSALDYATEAQLKKELDKHCDATQFIVSQRAGSIVNCDKIIVLEDGLAEIGTHDELLKKSSVYKEIYCAQFEQEDVVNA
ncbi:MAG: ABC transporter ATP-binding protein [Clostridia bacterium]|nr:ABC transporter ATP-binding protein [Clostridia bacterium]